MNLKFDSQVLCQEIVIKRKALNRSCSDSDPLIFSQIEQNLAFMHYLSTHVAIKISEDPLYDIKSFLHEGNVLHIFFLSAIPVYDTLFTATGNYNLSASFILTRAIHENLVESLFFITRNHEERKKFISKLLTAEFKVGNFVEKIYGGKPRDSDLYRIYSTFSEMAHDYWKSITILIKHDLVWVRNFLKLILFYMTQHLLIYSYYYIKYLDPDLIDVLIEIFSAATNLQVGVEGLFPKNFEIQDYDDAIKWLLKAKKRNFQMNN